MSYRIYKRTATRRKLTIGMYSSEIDPKNPYLQPSKLTKSKYELFVWGSLRRLVVTDIHNREVVLKFLISTMEGLTMFHHGIKPLPYMIFLTENGQRELLIDSSIHYDFIMFLMDKKPKPYA